MISAVKWLNNLDQLTTFDPTKCPNNCNRKFGGPYRKYNLKNHLLKECGIKMKCSFCHKEFAHHKSLRYHMGVAHQMIV